jgi:thiol:disulfide interchange protein DsbA
MKRFLVAALFALAAPAVSAQSMVERFQEGQHYFRIEPAQPTPADTIEVTEVFSYACIHCANFQPTIEAWEKKKPAQASFVSLPAAWNPGWEMLARAYYAAEALGVLDKTHDALFKAIHVEHRPFRSMQDLADWYAATAGIKAEDFLATANSSAVNIKVNRSKQLVPRYGVDGTPSVVVAGKYRVTGGSAGGWPEVMQVVDFLVAKEIAARASGRSAG